MDETVTRADVVRLEERFGNLERQLGDFIQQVQPLVIARSGELAMLEILRRDIDASHRKHHEADLEAARQRDRHDESMAKLVVRVQALEDGQKRLTWILGGAVIVAQIVANMLPDGLLAKIFGG